MNVLFLNTDQSIRNELKEFIKNLEGSFHFAGSVKGAVSIINCHLVDVLVMELNGTDDIALLKYANDNFKHIRVMLCVEKGTKTMISTLRNGTYGLLSKPVELIKLKASLSKLDSDIL